MSHIHVPSLKRPRSDYRPISTSLSTIVYKRRVPQPSSTLQEVMQASFQHNAATSWDPLEILEKKKRKLSKKRQENVIIAGPSESAIIRVSRPGPKTKLKRSSIDDDDDDWGAPPRPKKRPRPMSVIDLTISDDDQPPPLSKITGPKAKPKNPISTKLLPSPPPPTTTGKKSNKKNFIHAVYDSEMDIVTLYLEDIRPLPLEILTFNTRFLRQSLGNDINSNKKVGVAFNINSTRQNGSRSCFLSSSAIEDDSGGVEEISVGGLIWELPVEEEVIEILSESDVGLKENVPQKHSSTSQVVVRNRQRPEKRRGDDVRRSSSAISISSLPPPRAIPLSMMGHLKTQYPQQQRQQSRKQTIGDGSSSTTTPHTPVTTLPPLSIPKAKKKQYPLPPPSDDMRPPHSIRSSLNGGSDVDDYHPDDVVILPSAKALGKRKAISPIPTATAPHLPAYSEPSSTLVVPNNALNPFINSSAHTSSSTSLSTKSCHPFDTLASLYDQSSSADQNQSEIHQDNSLPTHGGYHSQRPSDTSPFFSPPDSLYDVGLPGDRYDHELQQQQQQPPYDPTNTTTAIDNDPWSSSFVTHSEGLYAYETIDPTLLGGGDDTPVGEDLMNKTIDPTLLGGDRNIVLGDESDLERDGVVRELGMDVDMEPELGMEFDDDNDDESSSSTSTSSGGSTLEKKKSVVQTDDDDDEDKEEKRGKEEDQNHESKLPPRKRTKRVIPDMIGHDDIDFLLSTARRKRRTTVVKSSLGSGDENDADDDDDHDEEDNKDEEEKKIRKPKPISIKKPSFRRSNSPVIETNMIVTRAEQKQQERDWPLEEVDSYCHQCRRKTFYAKMRCSACQKKFCVRCYAFR